MFFCRYSNKDAKTFKDFLLTFEFGAAQTCANLVDHLEKSLKNEHFVAKIGLDADESEPSEV